MIYELTQTVLINHTLYAESKEDALKEFDKMIDKHVCEHFCEVEDVDDATCVDKEQELKDRKIDFEYDEREGN